MERFTKIESPDEHVESVIHRYFQLIRYSDRTPTPVERKFAIERWKHRYRGAEGTLTVDEWNEMLSAHDYRCHWCNNKDTLTLDHVVPKCVGGGFTKDNIVPACEQCNGLRGEATNVALQAIGYL